MTSETPHSLSDESTDLDQLKAAILKAVVAEHIETAQPVGSSAVLASGELSVSSATIRSEMVSLEREGFLTQPHTSAGRVPTEKGYRYFVDHLARGVLPEAQQMALADFFATLRGETEEILEQTSRLMNTLTPYTSVVVAPSHASATILRAQLVDLGPRRFIAVVVLSDGDVVRRTVEVDFDVDEAQAAEASDQLRGLLVGTTLEQRVEVSSRTTTVAKLVREAVSVLHAATPTVEGDRVYIGGPAKVAESFDTVEAVRSVLGVLEKQLVVVSLLEDMISKGLSVSIGSETGHEPLSSAAVIVAPVHVDGQQAGAVGLLGPTRMNYPEALAVAEAVSEHLSRRLGGDHER